MEQILSGYCRTSDASRMVLVEDGEADCDFEVCAYRDVCQIGQQIADHIIRRRRIDREHRLSAQRGDRTDRAVDVRRALPVHRDILARLDRKA